MRCSRFCFVSYLLLPCSFPSQQRREPAAIRQATSKRNEKFEGKKNKERKNRPRPPSLLFSSTFLFCRSFLFNAKKTSHLANPFRKAPPCSPSSLPFVPSDQVIREGAIVRAGNANGREREGGRRTSLMGIGFFLFEQASEDRNIKEKTVSAIGRALFLAPKRFLTFPLSRGDEQTIHILFAHSD